MGWSFPAPKQGLSTSEKVHQTEHVNINGLSTADPAPSDPKPGTSTESEEDGVETRTLAERCKDVFDGLAGMKDDGYHKMTEKAREKCTKPYFWVG